MKHAVVAAFVLVIVAALLLLTSWRKSPHEILGDEAGVAGSSDLIAASGPLPMELDAVREEAVADQPGDRGSEDPDTVARSNLGPSRSSDPREIGRSALVLRLVEKTSGNPVASVVELWRIDAPASERWTRGDQRQGRVEVPTVGARFEDLAEGRYRVVCYAERSDAPGPPAFAVHGEETCITLAVELPEPRPAFIVIHDRFGGRFGRVMVDTSLRFYSSRIVQPPDWVNHRRRERPRATAVAAGGGVSGSAWGGRRSWSWVTSDARGFGLGPFQCDSREQRGKDRVRFRLPGYTDIECFVRGKDQEHREYVSVMLERGLVLRSIRRPDGMDAEAFAADVSITAGAILLRDAATRAPWTEVPVHVHVSHPGYESLDYTFRLADGALPVHTLKPRADNG